MRFAKYVKAHAPLVVYSEGLAYRPFLAPIVEEYASRNHPVAYVTSEKRDLETGWRSSQVKNFYVGLGARRTWFFQTLNARVLLLTMPDLEAFHIKRSVNPVHYVYTQHSLNSLHMVYREGAFDGYDTIFAANQNHVSEARALGALRGSRPQRIVEQGYVTLDELSAIVLKFQRAYPSNDSQPRAESDVVKVLLAPSWGPDGLIETIGYEVVEKLVIAGYHVIFRPHIRTMQLSGDKVDQILKQFEHHELFSVDFEPHMYETYATADVMVTAWSGAAFEFAFAFKKPVISIDVPKKIMNPNYRLIENEPLEVGIREDIGVVLDPTQLSSLAEVVDSLVKNQNHWASRLESVAAETVFNLGRSAVVGADYLESIMFGKDSN